MTIEKSNIYKRMIQKDFIYKAIYSLESYVFEKELLDEDDYKLMLELRDPFNHTVIDETIKHIKKLIEDVLLRDEFFEAQVYFRPKKYNKEEEKFESRPLHSASLITLIASVVLLNVLLVETEDENESDSQVVELTELARMLPSNFYGNIPSEKVRYLFKPWYYQFKEYTDAITSAYDEYSKTKEYRFEVTLDLKNFFPSIKPTIIFDEIISKYSVKYNGGDLECIKKILLKLLAFEISNLRPGDGSENFIKIYYDPSDVGYLNEVVWNKGIPQGLPHAYFFGNICMMKVAKIFEETIAGENGKAFYYVDDSVIYTNQLENEDELEDKINEINERLEGLTEHNSKQWGDYIKGKTGSKLKDYIQVLDKVGYLIKVHSVNSEKSSVLSIGNPKYGQGNFNAYSTLASMASYDLKKIFSDTEELILQKKFKVIDQALEAEIKRVEEITDDTDTDTDTSSYMKVLIRFKKFFKYRQRRLELNRDNRIKESDIKALLSNFNIGESEKNSDKCENFFTKYDEDILLNEFRFFFKNSPGFWKEAEDIIDGFNKRIYGDKYKCLEKNDENENDEREVTISYFHKISMGLDMINKIPIESRDLTYASIKRTVRENVWTISDPSKAKKEKQIRAAIKDFHIFFKNTMEESVDTDKESTDKESTDKESTDKESTDKESTDKESTDKESTDKESTDKKSSDKKSTVKKIIEDVELNVKDNNRYRLITRKTDELYRIIMNAYFSEVVSIDTNDLKSFVKRNKKPIYYNEARILFFLRNRSFSLENFYSKFKNYRNKEVLDYSLFEVVEYFEQYLHDPVYVDNLIMVYKYTSDIWKNGSKYLHFYTLHNQEHAIALIRSISKFMKSISYFRISKKDYYILFISCYLHDISMVLHPNLMESFVKDNRASNVIYAEFKQQVKLLTKNGLLGEISEGAFDYIEEEAVKKMLVDFFGKLDHYFEDYVRTNHPKQSARFIRKSTDFDFVEDEVKDIVAETSQAHGYDVQEIYKIKSNAKESLVSEKYIKILLRIGDLLDMSSSRISNPILANNQNSMSPTTQFHWLSHKAISNVDIEVVYELKDEGKDKKDSFVGPGSIVEHVYFVINLDIKHLIGIKKNSACKLSRRTVKGDGKEDRKEDRVETGFDIGISKEPDCQKCHFMCKWMKIKNDYLYKELEALQGYLNRTESNPFKTAISVRYKFNKGARRLKNFEYENINRYIENK